MGLQGVLSTRRDNLTGIVNGIDMAVWNPATDPHIPANYDNRTIGRRAANRTKLEERFGVEEGSGPIMSVVSRLTWQKGQFGGNVRSLQASCNSGCSAQWQD